MITAFSGTTIERNTAVSRAKDAPSTARKKIAVRPFRNSDRSMLLAIRPVTNGSRPVPAVEEGITVSRSLRTSAPVASSCGAVAGCTSMTAARPSGLGTGGPAEATPAVPASARDKAPRSASWEASDTSATTSSGPLAPGPKPSASRS